MTDINTDFFFSGTNMLWQQFAAAFHIAMSNHRKMASKGAVLQIWLRFAMP